MTSEEYDNHDCTISPDDGCSTCDLWFHQNAQEHFSPTGRGEQRAFPGTYYQNPNETGYES